MNGRNIIDSDQVLDMAEMPETLIVVGGGVIGVEYTCMFATLGVRVILVEKRPRLLEFADAEMVEALSYNLRDHRVTLRLNEEVQSVEETPDGGVVANLESKKKVSGDALLYAVGRQGNVDDLNLAAAGVAGRCARPHSGGCRIPHRAAAHLRGGRRDRIPQPGVGFHGARPHRRGARIRQKDDTPIRLVILTEFIRSRKFHSSGRPKSSSPTRMFLTKSAWRTIARSRAARFAATPPDV